MEEELITINSLIASGNEILRKIKYVPTPENVFRTYSVYRLKDESKYERWKNIVLRYLYLEYPNDISVNDFREAAEKFEKNYCSPTEMKKMLGILESLDAIPSKIVNTQKEATPIVINNTNSQMLNIDLFTRAIDDVFTKTQIKELKKVVDDEGGDVTKAKSKLIEKLKSFGENLSSNVVANLLTNPTIWASFF
ncbi:MAG: hypothetical protein J6W13_11830 [Salinivirgaceae bacterium]|nr:hypothetical protein [Salinivirgaceae bacterium]